MSIIIKDIFKGCIQSWYDITRYIIFRRKRSVIFAAPQHFNRGTNGKNPYFEKLIQVCKDNRISYLVLESPDYGAKQPRDCDTIRIDFIFWMMILLYKIIGIVYDDSKRKRTKIVARLIDWMTMGRLKTGCYITMAGLFIEMFQEINTDGIIYDLQHGIIYSGHPGYFESDNKVSKSLAPQNCKILLWGQGFKDLFTASNMKDKSEGKEIVIGYPIEKSNDVKISKQRNTILFSLQFTRDVDYAMLCNMKSMLEDALSEIDFDKYIVKLKHHPRFNDVIDINDILYKYPDIIITNETKEELISKCLLNVTWYSTTCFEFAEFGIPTYLLSDERCNKGYEIYYNQFKYPMFRNIRLKNAIRLADEDLLIGNIKNSLIYWYSKLYAPFDYNMADLILCDNKKRS